MQDTLTQPEIELVQTTIKLPRELWNHFRGETTKQGRLVVATLPEALTLWLEHQTEAVSNPASEKYAAGAKP